MYRWTDGLSSLPEISRYPECQYQITPGISSFSDNLDGLDDYFDKLFEYAESCLEKRNIPVYVLATAGMRLLPVENQNRIVKKIEKILDRLGFSINRVQVISGDQEGKV